MTNRGLRRPGPSAVLRTVDRMLSRYHGRRTVLVEARTPMNLAVLRPVFEPLRVDSRIRLRFTGPPRPDLRQAFAELGVAALTVPRERVKWMRIDLYINADPWSAAPMRRTVW